MQLASEIMGYHEMVMPNVLGCAAYPDAPRLGDDKCDPDVLGLGWVAFVYFASTKLAGSMVLTTLLVGFVIQVWTSLLVHVVH